jgi:hypothetical protein
MATESHGKTRNTGSSFRVFRGYISGLGLNYVPLNEEICLYNEASRTECYVIPEFAGSEFKKRTPFLFGKGDFCKNGVKMTTTRGRP